jgi:hypothetical protein
VLRRRSFVAGPAGRPIQVLEVHVDSGQRGTTALMDRLEKAWDLGSETQVSSRGTIVALTKLEFGTEAVPAADEVPAAGSFGDASG